MLSEFLFESTLLASKIGSISADKAVKPNFDQFYMRVVNTQRFDMVEGNKVYQPTYEIMASNKAIEQYKLWKDLPTGQDRHYGLEYLWLVASDQTELDSYLALTNPKHLYILHSDFTVSKEARNYQLVGTEAVLNNAVGFLTMSKVLPFAQPLFYFIDKKPNTRICDERPVAKACELQVEIFNARANPLTGSQMAVSPFSLLNFAKRYIMSKFSLTPEEALVKIHHCSFDLDPLRTMIVNNEPQLLEHSTYSKLTDYENLSFYTYGSKDSNGNFISIPYFYKTEGKKSGTTDLGASRLSYTNRQTLDMFGEGVLLTLTGVKFNGQTL